MLQSISSANLEEQGSRRAQSSGSYSSALKSATNELYSKSAPKVWSWNVWTWGSDDAILGGEGGVSLISAIRANANANFYCKQKTVSSNRSFVPIH